MKKVLNRLSSRLFLTGIAMLLQLGWIAYTLYEAAEVNPLFSVCLRVISVVVALYVVYKHIKTYNKLSWVFLILFLPILGVPCYFLFGRADMTKKVREQHHMIMDMMAPLRTRSEIVEQELEKDNPEAAKQSAYVRNAGRYPV